MLNYEVTDAARALYWYCADYHDGQFSALYEMLSMIDYCPSPFENGVKGDSKEIYDKLVSKEIDYEDLYAYVKDNS
jgi:hypothetical protein